MASPCTPFPAGIDRAVLFEPTDTRATFVTVSLANGKSEAWVQDRTGHKSSLMINKYRRAARTAAELQLGDFTDDSSAADPRDLAAQTDPKGRIVSGIVSNSGDGTPASDVESLMISASSPTRDRTGTPLRARDFKFDRGDSTGFDPCDSAGSDDVSQRLDRGVAFSDPVVAFSSDLPDDYFDTSRLLSTCPDEVASLTEEQAAALAGNSQLFGLLQGLAIMMGSKRNG